MNKKYVFGDVVNVSVIGSHCVYAKVKTDIPAIFISYLVANYTKATANMVSYLGLLFAFISSVFILFELLYWAAFSFYISFICDFIR